MQPLVIDEFKIYIRTELGLSEKTLLAYIYDVQEFCEFLGTQTLTARSIEEFINSLGAQELQTTTIRRKYMSIRCLCHHLISINQLDPDVLNALDSIRVSRRTPDALKNSDVDTLIAFLEQNISKQRATNVRRNVAIILIMYHSGLRVSELCSLNINDINIDKREIRVKGKGCRDRIVPTTYRCIQALQAYLSLDRRSDTEAIFVKSNGQRITRRAVSDMLTSLARAAKIHHTTAHTLRRSCATFLMDYGMDLELIQIMLGHQCLSSTQDYLAVDMDKLSKVHRDCHPLGEKNEA